MNTILCVAMHVQEGRLRGLGGALLARLPAGSWAVIDDALWEHPDGINFADAWLLFLEWARGLSRGDKPVLAVWGRQTLTQLRRNCYEFELSFPWPDDFVYDVREAVSCHYPTLELNQIRVEAVCRDFGVGGGVYNVLLDARDRANALAGVAKMLQNHRLLAAEAAK